MAKAFCQEPSRKKLETARTALGAIADGPMEAAALHIPPIRPKGRPAFHFRPSAAHFTTRTPGPRPLPYIGKNPLEAGKIPFFLFAFIMVV